MACCSRRKNEGMWLTGPVSAEHNPFSYIVSTKTKGLFDSQDSQNAGIGKMQE
jgi:hypothetical protein